MGLPWQRALVVGASSGIGAATARALAHGGCRVAVVARREGALRAVAAGLDGAGDVVWTHPHAVTRYGEVPALFQQICRELGGLALIVYSAGVMPAMGDDEYPFAKDRHIIEVNLLGAIAWLNEAAQRF